MPYIDLDTWPRRHIYRFFLGFDDPWFNLTAEVDVAATRQWCRTHDHPFSLACWFAVLHVANTVPAFRMRLRDQGVWEHDTVRVGATAMRDDQTFTYVYYPHCNSFVEFVARARHELERRLKSDELLPTMGDDDLLFCTVVPWVRFTGIKHARASANADSVPRIALGKATKTDDTVRMPVSVEAHHSLVDGVHIGAFLDELQAALNTPERTFAD